MYSERNAIDKMIKAHIQYLNALEECEICGIDIYEDSFIDVFIRNRNSDYKQFICEYFRED